VNLHNLPAEAITKELEQLRVQVAAYSPPGSMLESRQRERLQARLWQLQDELRRRNQPPERKARSRHWWTRRKDREAKPAKPVMYRAPSIEDKLNKAADISLARALGVE